MPPSGGVVDEASTRRDRLLQFEATLRFVPEQMGAYAGLSISQIGEDCSRSARNPIYYNPILIQYSILRQRLFSLASLMIIHQILMTSPHTHTSSTSFRTLISTQQQFFYGPTSTFIAHSTHNGRTGVSIPQQSTQNKTTTTKKNLHPHVVMDVNIEHAKVQTKQAETFLTEQSDTTASSNIEEEEKKICKNMFRCE